MKRMGRWLESTHHRESAQEFVVKQEKKLQNSVMVQKHFVIKIYAPFTNELAYETERDSQT